MIQSTFWLALAATAAVGVVTGASLDQSIKQLPARHRIGVKAFSAYSQAADLSNGVPFYATLGVSSALLPIAVVVSAYLGGLPAAALGPAMLAAVLALLHSLTTAVAAPTNFSQRRVQADPVALARV